MKFLKYFIGFLLVLIVFFVVRGLLSPSISYQSEITVNKPAAEAWAVMNDGRKTSEWLKDITDTKLIKGERGKVGSETIYTFSRDGQESKIKETIKEVVPNESISMDFLMEDVMTMDYNMSFSAKGNQTIIKSFTTVKGESLFMKTIMSFLEGTMKAQEDENLNNLKEVINSNTTNYFSPVK